MNELKFCNEIKYKGRTDYGVWKEGFVVLSYKDESSASIRGQKVDKDTLSAYLFTTDKGVDVYAGDVIKWDEQSALSSSEKHENIGYFEWRDDSLSFEYVSLKGDATGENIRNLISWIKKSNAKVMSHILDYSLYKKLNEAEFIKLHFETPSGHVNKVLFKAIKDKNHKNTVRFISKSHREITPAEIISTKIMHEIVEPEKGDYIWVYNDYDAPQLRKFDKREWSWYSSPVYVEPVHEDDDDTEFDYWEPFDDELPFKILMKENK